MSRLALAAVSNGFRIGTNSFPIPIERDTEMSRIKNVLLLVPAVLVSGCVASQPVDVVDLNKVLQALSTVLDESAAANPTASEGEAAGAKVVASDANSAEPNAATDGAPSGAGGVAQGTVAGGDAISRDPAKEAEFLKRYAEELNKLKVMTAPVGVSMAPGGEIVGFKDPNLNNVQDAGETKEFTVTIDPENQRLVASDNNGHHRPYGYRPGGFLTGYLIGSMLSRQSSFYSGPNAGARPDFRNTTMSPNDYHKSAVSSARARASSSSSSSSARMRTGSKGFSFGK
jgi:hypothetical protein